MTAQTRGDLLARLFGALLVGFMLASIVAAPLAATTRHAVPAAFMYVLWSPFCHQNPGRSFALDGYPLAVCHRCTAIYLGLLVSALIGLVVPRGHAFRRGWVIAATTPLLADAILPRVGLWSNTPATRVATGALFGLMLGSLLVAAISEWLGRTRTAALPVPSLKTGAAPHE